MVFAIALPSLRAAIAKHPPKLKENNKNENPARKIRRGRLGGPDSVDCLAANPPLHLTRRTTASSTEDLESLVKSRNNRYQATPHHGEDEDYGYRKKHVE